MLDSVALLICRGDRYTLWWKCSLYTYSMKFLRGGIRLVLVTVGVIMLTSFTIDATDSLKTSQSALSLFATSQLAEKCPTGTVQIDLVDGGICMDIYENSVGADCGIKEPVVGLETNANIAIDGCMPESKPGAAPWVHVSYHQAKTLCAKKGMRLPSANEWYESALGTPDQYSECNTDGGLQETGKHKKCVSSRGVYDSVGNVWEWVDGVVQNGLYEGRTVPLKGYVTEADTAGIALQTDLAATALFGKDYFWSSASGTYAIMRGGFHGSQEDAGVYATHMNVTPSFAGAATGFRCVKSL